MEKWAGRKRYGCDGVGTVEGEIRLEIKRGSEGRYGREERKV